MTQPLCHACANCAHFAGATGACRAYGVGLLRPAESLCNTWSGGANGLPAPLGPGELFERFEDNALYGVGGTASTSERFVSHLREPTPADLISRISVERGDLTRKSCDAIVNAANTTLLGGGGVDGAIHAAAGPRLLEECRRLGGCKTGLAKVTRGYELPCPWVIHTVGPVWRGGRAGEPQLLRRCYRSCLQAARQNKVRTLAFPSISTGAYRFPIALASRIALNTTLVLLHSYREIEHVTFVCFTEADEAIYLATLAEVQDAHRLGPWVAFATPAKAAPPP